MINLLLQFSGTKISKRSAALEAFLPSPRSTTEYTVLSTAKLVLLTGKMKREINNLGSYEMYKMKMTCVLLPNLQV